MDDAGVIYLDHAATSWPKPASVEAAMAAYLATAGSPGRSGHRMSLAATESVWATRDALAALLEAQRGSRFIFTLNATMSINLALFGFLEDGDTVLTTGLDHNSVLRPLVKLQAERNVTWETVPPAAEVALSEQLTRAAARKHPKLLVVSHASNVTGEIVPLSDACAWAAERDVAVLVDAAQTVGAYPISVADLPRVDFLAFSGHKALLGPQGTGVLYVAPEVTLSPTLVGGTGTSSESIEQPRFVPDGFESGTLNGVGIAGLGAAVEHVAAIGVAAVHTHESRLRRHLARSLSELEGVTVVRPHLDGDTIGVVSFTIRGYAPEEIVHRLDREFGILTRGGLHCAPAAHRVLGTAPAGTVRVSFGNSTTEEEITSVTDAVTAVALDARRVI